MPVMTGLYKGSELVETFTTLPYVKVVYAKGFSGLTNAKLVATFLPSLNIIRFRIDETTNDMLTTVSSESIIAIPTAATDSATVYSKSGAILVITIDTALASYTTALADATLLGFKDVTQVLSFSQTTNAAATNYQTYVNRDHGISIYEKSYLSAFNKRAIFNEAVKGVVVFAVNGFDTNKTWVKQSKDDLTGDIYFAFACASTGDDPASFGVAVKVAQNIGTLVAPTYILPDNGLTNMPALRYAYFTGQYLVTTGSTSPYPYIIASCGATDEHKIAFTIDVSILDKNYSGTTEVTFDFGAHYLGLFKSLHNNIYGIGGAISTELLGGSVLVTPFTNLTGIRVINIGGITTTDVRIRQRAVTVNNQVVLYGDYPALDSLNRIYVAVSEDNPSNLSGLYGAEIDITESGTYVLKTQLGGAVTITTNRLFYNPYYNGTESFKFTNVDADIFQTVTPYKVVNGNTEYRCFYVKNRHPSKTFSSVKIWSDYNCNYSVSSELNPQYLQMALQDGSRDGSGATNPVLTGSTYTPNAASSVIPALPSADVIAKRIASANVLLAGFTPDLNIPRYTPPATPVLDSVDLRTYTGPVDNQLSINSCVANAITSACEMFMQANGQFEHLSRRFLYYLAREADGLLGADDGSYISTALSAAKEVGLPLETTWPYTFAIDTPPSAEAYTEAATRKIIRYELIHDEYGGGVGSSGAYNNQNLIGHAISALNQGYPLIVAMPLSNQFSTFSGTFEQQLDNPYLGITPLNPIVGRHAVVVVGYSNITRTFIVENSWGATWGYQGYGLITYDVAKNDFDEIFAITDFAGLSIPDPAPLVLPTPIGATPPTGVTFGFADSESTALTIPNLGPQESVPIWVKRVINPTPTVVKEDVLSHLRMKVVY